MALAQSGSITARVTDAETGESVVGAVVTLTPKDASAKASHYTTAYKGDMTLRNIRFGHYTLSIAFLGYNTLELEIDHRKATTPLGELKLKSGVEIQTVVKEAKALRTSQKGDTVSYNAGAFKVAADADAENLLKKMPGISFTNGSVEAQGEKVQKILVDNKEFFGDDVQTAIKSLPAEAVKSIEVYNKLSDAAQFSGMDDGEGYKVINIVTHSNMRQGIFGKVYAGGGYDSDTKTEDRFKYIAGGNVNVFNKDSRLSVIGLFNNVNQQNFSFEDILGVTGNSGGGHHGRYGAMRNYMMRPQDGVATVNAVGVNYSDTWGKKNQVSFEGSYFFNTTNTTNRSTEETWYTNPYIDTLSTHGYSKNDNFNHRLNAKIEWKISENHNLILRPSFSYQSNDPWSITEGWRWGEKGYSLISNFNDNENNGYNLGTSATYRMKLGKAGRTLTFDASFRYSDHEKTGLSASNTLGYQPLHPAIDPETGLWNPEAAIDPETGEAVEYPFAKYRYLNSLTPSSSYTLRGNVTYTEPLGKHTQLSMQYRTYYDHQERDSKSYETDTDFNNGVFMPELSNAYQSGYLTQRIGPGIRYSKERNTLIGNVYYQRSTLDGQVVQDGAEKIRHNYNNFTYFVMGRLNINRENMLRLFISSYTDNPQITELQSVFNITNAQDISSGNPDLVPSYNHRVNFYYTHSNVEKGRTFMWSLYMNAVTDYITSDISYNGSVAIPGVSDDYHYLQYSRPVNMSGYWYFSTRMNYGFPIGFLKSNFNVSAGINYSLSPSRINGERNETQNIGYSFNTMLGSNISENVDFTLSWDGTYNLAQNSIKNDGRKNRYFNHSANANMKFVLPLGFTITASAAYTQYLGFTDNYNDDYIFCNLFIGKKLFKNKRGEVLLGVNDLFNQNSAFSRNVGSGWTQNVTNSVIGRYYMLQFTYNLRIFGKKGSRNMSDYGMYDNMPPHHPHHGMGGRPPRH